MASRPPNSSALGNWLKALALSPGVLFSAAYLTLHLAAALYLNTAFRAEVARAIEQETNLQFHAGLLSAGPSLESVTLRNVELRSIHLGPGEPVRTLKTITLPLGDRGRRLFSRRTAEALERSVCNGIINACRPPRAPQDPDQ
ncbi:hypothetical protein [Chlorobium sp. N1]|uniref:hypothetical protein n=1 Tax=Chlorobium sp. N1 TaxID=2491138 RepID=UPI00103B73D2|nr:hypothetical protein [Chlorobium sp. N1]TCD48624.1 hypothetical protein E0L29_01725 [Chlorobium sp. N1]